MRLVGLVVISRLQLYEVGEAILAAAAAAAAAAAPGLLRLRERKLFIPPVLRQQRRSASQERALYAFFYIICHEVVINLINVLLLCNSVVWDDAVDGKPTSESEIHAALDVIAERLGVHPNTRKNSREYSFTTVYQTPENDISSFVLYSSICDASIKNFVLDELKHDKYDIGHHHLSQDGDIALDIGGHVGGAALQMASKATGKGATVITFEPTRENAFYNQWNVRIYLRYLTPTPPPRPPFTVARQTHRSLPINKMWVNGFHQDRVVVLQTGLSDKEQDVKIQYSAKDTTGAGRWRKNFPHQRIGEGDCDLRAAYDVKMMGLEQGLKDLGIMEAGAGTRLRPGRRISFIKLDCEGCEYAIVPKFQDFWQRNVQFVAGEFHDHCRFFKKKLATRLD
jgi:hypothetical protein